MTNKKIFLWHPKYGSFEGLGDTVIEASKNCLRLIGKALKEKKVPSDEIKLELKRASTLITKNIKSTR